VVAESSNPSFLFETGLRTRFYLPKTSVSYLNLFAVEKVLGLWTNVIRLNGNICLKATQPRNVHIKDSLSTTT
jgi:hypothetical protein